ncbi:hypothetical protein GMI69_04720 [Eggerthellaceae bacterium zg-887]|uniref:Ltp family lipoprotein n=1 Tax=Xiamenia xianingshaonis TaxID=2682776 RepID=UPI00140CBF53|nr:Ltp family lipoprotein [Xiamenia xianingshaonis]NHM15970.1 hypothetical protein [Xiamenia xianingshaonis]
MEKTILKKAAQVALAGIVTLGCAGATATVALSLDPAQVAYATPAGKWKKSSGKWWYSYNSGGYAKGWQKIGGVWYRFDGSGWMKTGWVKDGPWYYLDSSGAMKTGWNKVGGTWYYHDASGAMKTGWQKIGGKWYYFNDSGAMAANRWVGDYYLESSGAMAANKWIGSYYVGSDGKWIKGYAVSTGNKALDCARSYLNSSAFSRQGLIDQLKYEGFSTSTAAAAVDATKTNWNQQAVKKAKQYLDTSAFSYQGLVDQLKFEKFTGSQAKHGASNCGANWNQQAVKKAQSYLKYDGGFTYEEMVSQLEYEGFSTAQAEYGAKQVGLVKAPAQTGQTALQAAQSYYNKEAGSGVSRLDITQYLTESGYSEAEATTAISQLKNADWDEQARLRARSYLDLDHMSYKGLVDQLEYEEFTNGEAVAAVNSLNVDWNDAAARSAVGWYNYGITGYNELYSYLQFDGFTSEQTVYGVSYVKTLVDEGIL